MSAVVWTAPYVPPAPPVVGRVESPFRKLTMSWQGGDGRLWPLNDYRTGVFLQPGVEGMHLPEFEDYVQGFAGLDGQEYDGGVAKPRNVGWTLFVYSDESSQGWLEMEAAWWQSFKPRGSYGTWTVQAPDGTSRSLSCRLTSDGGFAHEKDPAMRGWAAYPVTMMADDPWWYGEPLRKTWAAALPRMMFGGGELGVDPMQFPPLYFSLANTFTSAKFTNPGDEPTWPTWRIVGPVSSLSITVDGGTITVPPVAAGHTLVVNTDPSDPSAYDGATEVSGLVDPWDPRPFPPGRTIPVTLDIAYDVGASITVEARTKYWRAFG